MEMKKTSLTVPVAIFLAGGMIFVNCGGGGGAEPAAKGGTGGSAKGGSGGTTPKGGSGGTSIKGGGGGSGGSLTGGGGGTVVGGTASGGTAGTVPIAEPSKPIGYWKFDETDGAIVKDSSESKMDGTVVQGSSSDAPAHPKPNWSKGHTGMGLLLNGANEWVRIPDTDALDGTGTKNQVSISAWVKLDKYNEFKIWTVIAQRHQLASRIEQFMLGINKGAPSAEVNFFQVPTLVNVPLGLWVHLAFTYDGIKGIVYMDGVVVGENDLGWPVATDETPFTIGGGINENDVIENVPGMVDDVSLYDTVLTASEVDALAKRLAD
jgi:Concanavalin A-like lectin/glucanases superfamily